MILLWAIASGFFGILYLAAGVICAVGRRR